MRDRIYRLLVSKEALRDGGELPAEVVEHQPRNFLRHVQALALTKTGDGLVDPKLVLAWILGSVGAPASAVGLLVPIREAGALLPQLAMARRVDAAPKKKVLWALGATGQALAVAGMAWVAWPGGETGHRVASAWGIVALLGVFAVFRALCSVSYRPLQGATLLRGSRGAATGTAGSLGAAAVLGFGALLAANVVPLSTASLAVALAIAALLWLLAALCVLALREAPPEESRESGEPPLSLRSSMGLLKDRRFRRFCLVRAALLPTALAPPFLVTAEGTPRALGTLGVFVLASSGAAVLSSALWGRLADRSSRRVLMWSGWMAAAPLALTAWAAQFAPHWLAPGWVLPSAMFILMNAYHGVRIGRATHLVDMAPKGQRAAYTAVSNTLIGAVLAAASGFGVLAQFGGRGAPLFAFAALCVVAAWLARTLEEVQGPRSAG